MKHLINEILPKKSVVSLFGESGCGKSFVAIEMATAVACGVPFAGREPAQDAGTVVYVTTTSPGGVAARFRATAHRHGVEIGSNLYVPSTPVLLGGDISAFTQRLAELPGPVDLVVIDHLYMNCAAWDEDGDVDLQAIVDAAEDISKQSGATVLIVHSYPIAPSVTQEIVEYKVERKDTVVRLDCWEGELIPLMYFRITQGFAGKSTSTGEDVFSAYLDYVPHPIHFARPRLGA